MQATAAVRSLAGIGSGLMAGVQFAVALSVVPTLAGLPEEEAVRLHDRLGRHYDPTMPVIGLVTIAADLVAARGSCGRARTLSALAAATMVGVSTVSHLGNVPVNRRIRARSAGRLETQWQDPRPHWRRLHHTRTALAVASLALTVAATAVDTEGD